MLPEKTILLALKEITADYVTGYAERSEKHAASQKNCIII